MTWLIYTFGNGNMLFDVFTSIALMVGAGYESLIRLAMLGLTFGALAYIIGRGRVPWQLLCGAVMLFAVTVQIRANVTIQDLVNPGVPTRTVANIPLAVAFPAYVASEAGFQLLTLAETAFALTVPPEYQVINATLGKGFYDFQKLLGAQLPDGDLQRNLTEYIKECVIPALQRGELSTTAVFHNQDMLAAINVAGALDVMRPYVAGVRAAAVSCTNAYTNFITPAMAPGGDVSYDLAMKQLRQAFGVPDVALGEEAPVTTAMTRILGTGQVARAAINNVLIRERWQSAEELINQRGNDPAAAIALLGKQLGEDLKSQAFSQSIMNARFLPMLRTMAESCVYFLTPIALVLAFTPSMFGTIRSTVMAYSWLLLWAPLYGIVNYLIYAYGTVQLTSLVDPGVGITYANYVDFYDMLNQLNSFSSSIAWGVPTMAAMLSYGLGSAVSFLSSAGQGFQAAASHEASQLAHGQLKYTDPNRHLEYQDQMSIDAAGHEHHEQMLRSSSGMLSVNQTGTREMSFSDGSHTTIGTTGTITHQGPDGYYSQDKDGHYLSGVWRQDVQDEESGQTIAMQREVLGAEIRSRGAFKDANGVQHHVEQMENQYDHSQLYREESWSVDGVQHSKLTQGDGSKVWKTDGFVVTAPVGPDGQAIGTPRPFREQNTFVQAAPTDANPHPGWEHQYGELTGGHGGQEHYATSMDTSGEAPDGHNYVRHATGGSKNNNVSAKDTSRGLSVSRESGAEADVGSVSGTVAMDFVDKNGNRHSSERAVLLGNGVPLDHDGTPQDGFTAHAVTNDGGKQGVHEGTVQWNAETGKWEMQETDAQYHSRLDTHKSGSRMQLPSAGLTLESGQLTERGSGDQTSFSYDGLVTDKGGNSFRAHVEGKDGKISYSDLSSGGTQHVVEDDGRRLTLTGKEGGNDFTYEESWTGPAFKDDGHGHLTPIGQTHFMSRGHATLDESRGESLSEQLVRTPDTTVAENKSAFGQRSLAVSVAEHPLSDLPIGTGSMSVDTEHGQSEVGDKDVLHGGEGKGYVISVGAGSEMMNAVEKTQVVKGPEGGGVTERLIEDSNGQAISGQVSGVVDSRTRNAAGELESQVSARGRTASGEFEILTKSRSNENTFTGTFDVPHHDRAGSTRVSGKIDFAPSGDVTSMSFTNTANGKQIGYRNGKFTVADVEADPNHISQRRVTNEREVSHREAESAGGFYVKDVLNQAGEVIFSHGDRGTNRAEYNQFVLFDKIDNQSTLTAKAQQSSNALGMAEPFSPDQPGPWRDVAIGAEGVNLGWRFGMEATRGLRINQAANRSASGGRGPASQYDPNAPLDPSLRNTYDAARHQVEEFMRIRGIAPHRAER